MLSSLGSLETAKAKQYSTSPDKQYSKKWLCEVIILIQ